MDAQSSNTNQKICSSRKNSTLQALFTLESVSESDKILSLISHCTITFTFTDPSESPSQQELKRQSLVDLLCIIKASKKPLQHDKVLSPLMAMILANIFRPLPPPSNPSLVTIDTEFPEEEDPVSKLSRMWSHLQLVYELLLRVIINTETKKLSPYMDHHFLVSLLSLFQSEDPRERESLKNVYHRVYSRFTLHRSFMRKSMNDVLLNFMFETDQRHSGIGELLEIWGSIINGFTVPLKEEHKLFLMRVLIPLHKTKGMQGYHRQLAYCVSQFVQKEPMLGGVVVRGILKYWPVTNCQKEILLIGELEELVENIDTDQYRKLALPLCTQITRCLNSWNSQVAERALYVWNNEHFVKMASMAMEEVFPIVVEGMERNLKWHWSKSVCQLTANLKVMLEEMDQILYSKCLEEINHRESVARQAEIKRKETWDRIEMAAAKNHRFMQQKQPSYICV